MHLNRRMGIIIKSVLTICIVISIILVALSDDKTLNIENMSDMEARPSEYMNTSRNIGKEYPKNKLSFSRMNSHDLSEFQATRMRYYFLGYSKQSEGNSLNDINKNQTNNSKTNGKLSRQDFINVQYGIALIIIIIGRVFVINYRRNHM